MVYAPGTPRRQIVPRSMYQAPAAPSVSAPGAAPGAVRGPPGRNYAPMNAPAGLNNARPVAPATAPGNVTTPISGGRGPDVANPAAESPGVHPVAATNAFGAIGGGATPDNTFRQDPQAMENVSTGGGFRQYRPLGQAPAEAPVAVKSNLATTDENPATPISGFEVTPTGGGSARRQGRQGAGPRVAGGTGGTAVATPTGTGSTTEVSTTDGSDANAGVGTSSSGLTAAPGTVDAMGETSDGQANDNPGTSIDEYGNDPEKKKQREDLAAGSGEDLSTINALFRSLEDDGWSVSSVETDDTTGAVASYTRHRKIPMGEIGADGDWVDPATGKEYSVIRTSDGTYYAEDSGDVTERMLNIARDRGAKTANSGNGQLADAEFAKLIEEMKNLGNSPEDKAALENQIAVDRQRNAYETSRALLANMEGGALAGLSADASAGRGADLQLQGGLAGAENESRARLEASKQQVENQLRAIQLQAAMLGQKMSQAQQIEVMKLQSRLSKQLAAYEKALNTPTIGEAIGGAFGNIAGAGLNLLTFGGANAIAKSIWGKNGPTWV